MKRKRLTPYQRYHLSNLERRIKNADGTHRWHSIKSLGGRKVWDTLAYKGFVDLENRPGPMGGAHYYVRIRPV